MLAVANGDVRLGGVVHPDPLVGVVVAGQPVVIRDVGGVRRQRLPDLRRARDRRRARRKGVRRRRDGRRRHAGQRLGVAGSVGEAHPHLDRHALVRRHQRVGACRRQQGDVRLGGAVHPDPLVGVVCRPGSPSSSAMSAVSAVSVCPTCAVPVIVGAPVARVFAAAVTVVVASLVSVSALPAVSVKLTVTLIVMPWSAATSV